MNINKEMEVKGNLWIYVSQSDKLLHREALHWMVLYLILINHQPQHCLLVFIDILVLPVHSEPPFLVGFQEEDLPTKQPTKQILGQLWDSSSFSFFLWLMPCFPAAYWSVYGSVSDWWSFTSRHVSSAAPVLPARSETLKNREKRQQCSDCCTNWLSVGGTAFGQLLVTVWTPPLQWPFFQYFLFTDTIWFS